MQSFRVEHAGYGALRFGVSLHLVDRQGPELRASIWAEGFSRSRERWRGDFIEWCRQHGLSPFIPAGGRRRRDTSEFVIHLTSWAQITEFMLRWVGTERMIDAVYGADGVRMAIGEDVRRLQRQVQELAKLVIEMRKEARDVDLRLQAAASTFLGRPAKLENNSAHPDQT